ncbi:hypothetical protein VTN77DRAFT_1114 [Rasamsonia byssochlamydoides]|uniref:uncharacterized protein n=1 Tax=Rasamsonia byssochlamydoides TaxID=89139 RepID=UPI0037431C9C
MGVVAAEKGVMVVGVIQNDEPAAMGLISQPLSNQLQDVHFGVVQPEQTKLLREPGVCLPEAVFVARMDPRDVGVWMLLLEAVAVFDCNLGFPDRKETSPSVHLRPDICMSITIQYIPNTSHSSNSNPLSAPQHPVNLINDIFPTDKAFISVVWNRKDRIDNLLLVMNSITYILYRQQYLRSIWAEYPPRFPTWTVSA